MQGHSAAYHNVMRICSGLVLFVKRMEPFLKGTPAETPVAVFSAVADVIEVRIFLLCSLALCRAPMLGRQR
jgi:hypothetical protein